MPGLGARWPYVNASEFLVISNRSTVQGPRLPSGISTFSSCMSLSPLYSPVYLYCCCQSFLCSVHFFLAAVDRLPQIPRKVSDPPEPEVQPYLDPLPAFRTGEELPHEAIAF